MTMPDQALTLKDRLEYYSIKRDDCSAAIREERVPLALGMEVTQACVVRGIRYHVGFALDLQGTLPVFTRALHSRSIMSNAIPDIEGPDNIPYCIWYPEIATESTYHLLASKYPEMRYQVGRACAVAGYVNLYRSLHLLPEVSIAEEARDNEKNPGSKAIFDDIMASPVRYAVMDDYTRSVDLENPKPGVRLNADTAVRSTLDENHVFEGYDVYTTSEKRQYRPFNRNRPYFNITEDFGISDEGTLQNARSEDLKSKEFDTRTQLFYFHLPIDLPNINKDLLILRAAYSGNIERYVRLRRPGMISGELACILRGIYHDTMFAKFWSFQPESKINDRTEILIRRAINARFIMNNDLSRISVKLPQSDLPYLIYYPNFATIQTYQELLRRQPSMKPQIARAYLIMDEQELWDALAPEPNPFLFWEANDHANRYYVEDLERRDPNVGSHDVSDHESGKCISFSQILKSKQRRGPLGPTNDSAWFNPGEPGGIYDGLDADFENLEHLISGLE